MFYAQVVCYGRTAFAGWTFLANCLHGSVYLVRVN
jgi:hypothetical protein